MGKVKTRKTFGRWEERAGGVLRSGSGEMQLSMSGGQLGRLVGSLLRRSSTATRAPSGPRLTRLPREATRANLNLLLQRNMNPQVALGDVEGRAPDTNEVNVEKSASSLKDIDIKTVLRDASNVNDRELTCKIVKQFIEDCDPHQVDSSMLTFSIQLLEGAAQYDRASSLYEKHRRANRCNVIHLTAILRALKHALVAERSSYHAQKKQRARNSPSVSEEDVRRTEAAIQARLQQIFDVYDDAIFTDTFVASSTVPIAGAKRSVIVVNALLACVRAVPAEILALNPGIVEQCLAVALAVNEPTPAPAPAPAPVDRNGTLTDPIDLQSSLGIHADDVVPLHVQPHHGVYAQLMSIAGNAEMYSVVLKLYENMLFEAKLPRTTHTVLALLTAAGSCKEYDECVRIFNEEFKQSANDELDDLPDVDVGVISKFMEICSKSNRIEEGLTAFFKWNGGDMHHASVSEPDWYCLSRLNTLGIMEAMVPKAKTTSDRDEYDREKLQNIKALQEKAIKFVSDAAIAAAGRRKLTTRLDSDRTYRTTVSTASYENSRFADTGSNNHAIIPYTILAGPVGAHLISHGYTEEIITLIDTQRMEHYKVRDFWRNVTYYLSQWGQWRALQALTERLLIHHRKLSVGNTNESFGLVNIHQKPDLPVECKARLLGVTANAICMARSIDGKDRAIDILEVYLPALAFEVDSSHYQNMIDNTLEIFFKELSSRDDDSSSPDWHNISHEHRPDRRPEEYALTEEEALQGSEVFRGKNEKPAYLRKRYNLCWTRHADATVLKWKPYVLSDRAADMVAPALAVLLKAFSEQETKNYEHFKNISYSTLQNALKTCNNGAQTLQCLLVYSEFCNKAFHADAEGFQENAQGKGNGAEMLIDLPMNENTQRQICQDLVAPMKRTKSILRTLKPHDYEEECEKNALALRKVLRETLLFSDDILSEFEEYGYNP